MLSTARFLVIDGFVARGSSVSANILMRHLRLLCNAGSQVGVFVNDISADNAHVPEGIMKFVIPPARAYWPPGARLGSWVGEIRNQLTGRAYLEALGGYEVDAIFNIFSPAITPIAAQVARRLKARLFVFLHDDWREAQDSALARTVACRAFLNMARSATHVWAASEELAECARDAGSSSVSVLYPMPASPAKSTVPMRIEPNATLTLAYAGSVYEGLEDALLRLATVLRQCGWQLLVFTQETTEARLADLRSLGNVTFRPYLPPQELLGVMATSVTASLVIYPLVSRESMLRLRSFPCKFVEQAQLGIPVVVLADERYAVSRWCKKNQWLGYFPRTEVLELRKFLANLAQRDIWERVADQAKRARAGDFSPVRIQAQFEHELENCWAL